jgi:hypothetical protein
MKKLLAITTGILAISCICNFLPSQAIQSANSSKNELELTQNSDDSLDRAQQLYENSNYKVNKHSIAVSN